MTHRIGVGVGTREGLGSCCSEGGMDGGAKGREGERASTGCVACARRIFGTRVTSPARVATAHTHSQSVSRRHRATHAHARRSESDGHGFIQGPRELYRAF